VRTTISLLLLFISTACVSSESWFFQPVEPTRLRRDFQAVGSQGAVATAHPLASEAAMEILKSGGNAVDAAVAASFVISVVRPQSTGIGGGGFLVLHDARQNKDLTYDFRERAPRKATRDMFVDEAGQPIPYERNGVKLADASVNGHLSVGTPGLIAGLEMILKNHGSKSLKEVMAASIRIAANGFDVYQGLAEAIEERKEVLQSFSDSRKIFLPNKVPLKAGDKLIQADLAKTLQRISEEGASAFYKGKIAQAIIAEMKRGGGIINDQDLANYQVKVRPPVVGTFRGKRIVSMPPPSSGGVHIIQMLNMFELYDLKKQGHTNPKTLHIIAEVMRRAFADRAELLGDPDFTKVPVRGLLSKTYAKSLAESIDMNRATPSSSLGKSRAAQFESSSTTHISIVDAKGNAVATTQTINYTFGSGVVAEGTGIVLNDEMDDFSIKPGVPNAYGLIGSEANAVAPLKTMLSSMSPTIVTDAVGNVEMVVGSPGGPRIISATLLTILNSLEFNLPLVDAVHHARIHHQWMPDLLRVEPKTIPADVQKSLESMGHKLKEVEEIGDVQAIRREGDKWVAVSDTRSEGRPLAY